MATEYNIQWEYCKKYKTKEGLKRAIKDIPDTCRYFVHTLPDSRITAVFFHVEPEYLYGVIAHLGFHVIG